MHSQMYDVEEEFEPRITPKPTTKLDHFALPSVPEVSLIFEKPAQTKNLIDANISRSTARPMQLSDKSVEHINITSPNSDNCNVYTVNPTSTSLDNHDSYMAWKEQIYSRENNYINTTRVSPLYKNIQSYNHASQLNMQDTTVQKQQEQSKIYDTQNRLINMRPNDGTCEKNVKFRCSNTENSHGQERGQEREGQLLSSDKEQLLSCKPEQRATCVTDPAMRISSNTFVDALKQNERLQIPYTPCPYPFQQFYAPNYSNRDIDNNETVKTLLQLVNNQSEQIKTLQLQVDRLVRLQEENFRNKSTCTCSSPHANQLFGYSAINCYDTTNTRLQSHNQGIKQNTEQTPLIENKNSESVGGDSNKLEVALLEQQSKKAFMEQKVSIGVMTSFEFTVQNSPFLVDSEILKEKEISAGERESNDINRRNTVNMHDTSESVKKYKNAFTRKAGTAQLENIVEDTESYLSSSHQQSSNFNASSSVRDSERHISKQSDLYNITNISESPKMYQRFATDVNREKMHEKEMYTRKDDNTDEQVKQSKIISNTRRSASSPVNANCSEAFVVNDAYDYTATYREKNNERKASADKHNAHLPTTNYYQSHRNKEPSVNIRETRNVGDSMVLSRGDLKVLERPPPTPEPSIHVEMQEYTSDDESDKLKRTSKIGWTFYNNVLGQVNEILQNSSVIEDKEYCEPKSTRRIEQEDETETRAALNTVKTATLEQLRKLGINITDNEHRESNGNNKTLDFDSSYYPRLNCQTNMMHTTSVVNETNTSMHMKALALKYLGDEQLTDIALHKQGSSSLKHLMLSNMQGTNMSIATMRYLERYQLLPGRNQDVRTEDTDQVYGDIASKRDFKPTTEKNNPALRQFPFVQTPGTTCPSRILDISTLKRQPKLL